MHYLKQGLLLTTILFLLSANGFAASDKPLSLKQASGVQAEISVSRMQMPLLDNILLSQSDDANPQPTHLFAAVRKTQITPTTHGTWENVTTSNGNKRIWRLSIQSLGALSLSLAFSKYQLPEGSQLYLYASGHSQLLGPYTQKDATKDNQLWTPIILGDTIIVEINIPADKESELVLELSKINHGYKAASAKATGTCNIDVACTEGNTWQDQIRSVVMYTYEIPPLSAGGSPRISSCSGSLINNTTQDNTPYLLTANHCSIDASNSNTAVIYFNYQNPSCRTGLATNGTTFPRPTTSLVGGVNLIASYDVSDFKLLKIINPIPNNYNVFFAGWDRSQILLAPTAAGEDNPKPPLTATGIHHPNGEEKRISIVSDPNLLKIDFNRIEGMPLVKNSHIRILRWMAGTTESGSSGSPLFDQNKRIVGQLSGGSSACATSQPTLPNFFSDFYGRFFLSWNGSSSPTTRLSDWLDPNNTGMLFINGKNANNVPIVNVLENSIPRTILSSLENSSQDYIINIPNGAKDLIITTRSLISNTDTDADLYIKFASKPNLNLYDERSWTATSNEDIIISNPQAGVYHISVYGFTDYSDLILLASYKLPGTALKKYINNLDVKIIDNATIKSTLNSNYSNIAGNMTINIDIKHTDISDLNIFLVAPNNQRFIIKNASTKVNSTLPNLKINTSFAIPAGISNGLWRLDIQDTAKLDTGYLDSWTIIFP